MEINYKILTIVLLVIVIILTVYFLVIPTYTKAVETKIAKFQANNLQFLWNQDGKTILVSYQELYLLFQQMEKEATYGG